MHWVGPQHAGAVDAQCIVCNTRTALYTLILTGWSLPANQEAAVLATGCVAVSGKHSLGRTILLSLKIKIHIVLSCAAGDGLKVRATKHEKDSTLCAHDVGISIPGRDQLPLCFAWPVHVDQHKLQVSYFGMNTIPTCFRLNEVILRYSPRGLCVRRAEIAQAGNSDVHVAKGQPSVSLAWRCNLPTQASTAWPAGTHLRESAGIRDGIHVH